jgi:histidinol-phosphate aminotransferase
MAGFASISRRRFAHLLGLGAAYAVTPKQIRPSTEPPAARRALRIEPAPVVRLNSNENPYGPSPQALTAMTAAFSLAWRYPDEHADALIEKLSQINSVKPEQILLGDGSGEILKMCAAAFTGAGASISREVPLSRPTRGGALVFTPGRGNLVVADPTFEAILNHARVTGADVVKVPLTKSYSHDLGKMAAAAREGLIYICNPNNPTATITPKSELRDFIKKVPRATTILVDEAYFHYADSAEYESVIPMIANHPNLIVARTFSKIYGMAGLRCGYCVAHPEAVQRLRPHQTWDSVNIMALVAANASLLDAEHVATGRRLNSETRKVVCAEIERMGYQYIPSQANFMMIDTKRPARPVIEALKQHGVQVGRPFPTLPNHLRVTIGKQAEMETFLSAFRRALA